MKSEQIYKHEASNVLEALGIKRSKEEFVKVAEDVQALSGQDQRLSVILAKIVELANTPEEAVLIALRMGQERGKKEAKAEVIATVLAALFRGEGGDGISVMGLPAGMMPPGMLAGMVDEDGDGPMVIPNAMGDDPMYR